MIVSATIITLTEKVKEIINALANRLTAEDNFGPEGIKGQVLTSNGSEIPPSYQNLGDILSGISPEVLEGIPGLKGADGAPGLAGADGANGAVPLFIAATETFSVPANRQMTYTVPIDVEGVLDINGVLSLVD